MRRVLAIRHQFSFVLVSAGAFFAVEVLYPFHAVSSVAQSRSRTFPEIGKSICGKFLDYWTSHGSLAQQRFQLTKEYTHECRVLDV